MYACQTTQFHETNNLLDTPKTIIMSYAESTTCLAPLLESPWLSAALMA